ncbi:DUF262 domain-containing protein [Chryseobacterium viscerum]|uniref:DUF262 domain-containing protein n=1 Tax=Chryseobacterium viscerum TaxID=1037377 RepID=A0A316W9V0_9FLAO|nr:DUF262 domain-containing protein [Chryseobacterium viscerum]PWN58121.1 DUF262 domain-containing protein [Chryseobacterium viscerum]
MQNILELKTINEIQKFTFHIPSYQRGYKWGSKEVTELLNDINDFVPRLIDENLEDKTWYCLQPVVLKNINEDSFEVIDGQQRLTTIYLILYYLNQDFVENRRDKLFEIVYKTREGSGEFLKTLTEQSIDNSNIDFFYISTAYKTICDWFENQTDNFDKGAFRSKLKFNSKIIWYLSNEEDAISIFTRINIGKIPLTNAELIKALFLNSSNFNNNENKLRLRQLEIATEWDNIEFSLQDNKFWFFLNQKQKSSNRIEFIFDLMNTEKDINDPYSTFRFFNKKFSKGNHEELVANWEEIKRYYQRFSEWYNERDLYHKIGYLISSELIDIKDLYEESDSYTKSRFKDYIDEKIKDDFRNIEISELQYADSKNVKKTLLLYNILTMLNSEKDNAYFPFDLFKNENWDIEHIASIKEKIPEHNRNQWLVDANMFIEDDDAISLELKNNINKWSPEDEANEKAFSELYYKIIDYFNQKMGDDDDINDISNLTLLDSATNRGYKNALFPVKRKTIIDRDKQGVFIPVCTKNVFLKYFSEYPPKMTFWTRDDRDNYEKDLHNILENYLS